MNVLHDVMYYYCVLWWGARLLALASLSADVVGLCVICSFFVVGQEVEVLQYLRTL